MIQTVTGAVTIPTRAPHGPSSEQEWLRAAVEEVGVDTADIEALPFDLSVLMDEGIVVDVDARGTTMFDTTLDLMELGVSWRHERRSPIKPVNCVTVPSDMKQALVRPAAQGHQILRKYSYHFLVLEVVTNAASNRWVPWRAWPEFKQAFARCAAALSAARAEYRDNH